MTLRSVISMISMVKMPSRKEWVVVVVAMIHLTSSNLSLVGVRLEVRIMNNCIIGGVIDLELNFTWIPVKRESIAR